MQRHSLLLVIAACMLGCGSTTDTPPVAQTICTPGSTQICVCPGGWQGAQTCAMDGMSWEKCSCMPAVDAGPDSEPTTVADSAIPPDTVQPDPDTVSPYDLGLAATEQGLPPCKNYVKDGDETDIDCGGITCLPCQTGKYCKLPSDCVSKVCYASICKAPACNDGVQNAHETDIDCGGDTWSCATRCEDGAMCVLDSDCVNDCCDTPSRTCDIDGVCVEGSCWNGKQDGSETDIDCGGMCIISCDPGEGCKVDWDCKSGSCTNSICD